MPTTREKILKEEFIDFFSLLYFKEMLGVREKEILKHQKVDRTWANGLPGFLVYVGVIAKVHPCRNAPSSKT